MSENFPALRDAVKSQEARVTVDRVELAGLLIQYDELAEMTRELVEAPLSPRDEGEGDT